MKIITISGLDGSGKSTQIQLLKNELERIGSKVFYFHAIEFSLANRITKLFKKIRGTSEYSARDSDGNNRSVTTATPFQIWLRKIFLRIDIWRFGLLRNKLRNQNYDYILSDRYFYDSVVNIEYLSLLKLGFRKFLKPSFRRPDIAIYLQTTPEKIMQRDRVPDQGLEYLEKKKELYDAKTALWNWMVIDGNRDKTEIFTAINKML